ncbi:E3 ubiquitin-protein ligase RNF25-like [Daphnia pulex]|uniref:E3 ubiquitin-protein ligase RNF25-like n=1 Tax=Daphnia pulex TaxID=6669 RepID=UPI001EDCD2B5|nr:E3 ubiquitin-protein ligase RNF25-like [Daphnia pulex]XP_046444831.1 E3 ubiquitin-protein ligase RNF25-like [Daphnia pulex]
MNNGNAHNESDQSVLEEIEALEAILFSELDVTYSPSGRPIEFRHTLYPSTADDANQHYVCLTLVMKFPAGYPDQPPSVNLKNPRGLGDDFLANALKLCNEKCQDFSGSPVIYEIIELLRECLTNSNRPTGHCTICLFDFHPDDVFTYTPCYHHFHSHCLSRFCESMQTQWKEEDDQETANNPRGSNWKEKKTKQFTCPVCREVINVELASLKLAPPPHEVENFQEQFSKDAKFTAWRKEMDKQYHRQKTRGGIIDKDMEDSRFLVVTENTAATSPSTAEAPSFTTEKVVQQSQSQPEIKAAPVQAPSTSKPVASRPDWSRPQQHNRRPVRGKWIRSSDSNGKERPVPAQNIARPSNPPNRQSSTEKHNSQPRHRAEESTLPVAERPYGTAPHPPPAARSNGTAPHPPSATQVRPPPGFAPR